MGKHKTNTDDAKKAIDEITIDWVTKNLNKLLLGILAIVLISVVVVSVQYFQTKKVTAQFDELYTVEKEYADVRKRLQDSIKPKTDEKIKKATSTEIYVEGDLDKDYKVYTEKAEAFIRKDPKSNAAAVAAVTLGKLYYEFGKYDQAKQILTLVTDQASKKQTIVDGILETLLGTVEASSNDSASAIKRFQSIVADPEKKLYHPTALYKLGILHFSAGDMDKTKEILNQLINNHSKSQFVQSARGLKRLIQLRTQSKN